MPCEFSLNAESRLLDLEILLVNNSVDVICISETWLQTKHLDSAVSIAGFQSPVRCDRPSGRCGVVAIYARNRLYATAIKCAASPLFQCTGVSVTQSRRSPIAIIVTYSPPDSDADWFVDFIDLILS